MFDGLLAFFTDSLAFIGNNNSRSFTQTNTRFALIFKHLILLDKINLCMVFRDVVKISNASVIVIYSLPVALILSNAFCFRLSFRIALLADQAHFLLQYLVLTVFAKKVFPQQTQILGICSLLLPMKQVFHYQIVTIIIFHFVIIYISGQIWYKKPSSSAVNPIPAKTRKRSTCLLHVPRFYMIFNKLCQPSIKEKQVPNHHQHPLIFLKIRGLFYLFEYNRY